MLEHPARKSGVNEVSSHEFRGHKHKLPIINCAGHQAYIFISLCLYSPNSFKSLCQKVSFPTVCGAGFWTSGASIPPVFSTN